MALKKKKILLKEILFSEDQDKRRNFSNDIYKIHQNHSLSFILIIPSGCLESNVRVCDYKGIQLL